MIIFVCTGNTCRSPMAEAIFNAMLGEEIAISRGLAVNYTLGAAENAKTAAAEYGGNLEKHISRQITEEEIKKAGLIITMTSAHKNLLSRYTDKKKVMTLSEFAGETGDVSDPYGGDTGVYLNTAEQIYGYIKKGILRHCTATSATDKDLAEILSMENEYFTDSWSENAVRGEIEKGRAALLKFGKKTIAYCIYMVAADEGEILRIATKRSLRGCNLGKKLLSFVIEGMKEKACSQVFLEVRASNTAAISLYKATGFEEIGVRKGYYKDNREDALLFSLTLI